jgi:hypothetical protein
MIIVGIGGDGRTPTQQMVIRPHTVHQIPIRTADGGYHTISISADWVPSPEDAEGTDDPAE